jgi:hypothetical protein
MKYVSKLGHPAASPEPAKPAANKTAPTPAVPEKTARDIVREAREKPIPTVTAPAASPLPNVPGDVIKAAQLEAGAISPTAEDIRAANRERVDREHGVLAEGPITVADVIKAARLRAEREAAKKR